MKKTLPRLILLQFITSWCIACYLTVIGFAPPVLGWPLQDNTLIISDQGEIQEADDGLLKQSPDKPTVPEILDSPRCIDPSEFMPEKLIRLATQDFRSSSLADLIQWLQTEQELTVLPQQSELDEIRVLLSDPVDDWLNNEPIYAILDRLSIHKIGWYYQDDIIYLTTKDDVKRRLITIPYYLGELLDEQFDGGKIQSIIKATIAPNSWEGDGGDGRSNRVGDMIFVRNTESIHRSVRAFLLALSKPGRQTFLGTATANIDLRDRLSQKVTVDYQDYPLVEVLADLSKQTQANIRLDLTSIRSTRIRDRQPITLKLDDRPLSLVLDYLVGELGLAWVIRDGVLWVTHQKSSETGFLTAVYDVRDLCIDESESAGLAEAIISQMPGLFGDDDGDAELEFAKPGTMVVWASENAHADLLDLLEKYRFALRNSKVRTTNLESDKPQTLYFRLHANIAVELRRVLPELVEPESWTENGRGVGADAIGTIRLLESVPEISQFNSEDGTVRTLIPQKVLAIYQRQSVHQQIKELIWRIENGDPDTKGGFGYGGMGGGMGGFGGGYFSIPEKPVW